MAEKDNILSGLKPNEKPKVPQSFFEDFSNQMVQKIESEEGMLSTLSKSDKPSVDANFFENFADDVWSKVESKSDHKDAKPKVKYLYWFSAAAAILILCLFIPLHKASIEGEYALSELSIDDEDLLAYFSESEMIDYIVEASETVELNDEYDELLYDELEDELYEYYTEL